MTSSFINEDGTPGHWETSNPKLMMVEQKTGAVVASHETSSQISYTVDSFCATDSVSDICSRPWCACSIWLCASSFCIVWGVCGN